MIPLLLWQLLVIALLSVLTMWGISWARKRRWYVLGVLIGLLCLAVAGLCISYYDAWYPCAVVTKENVLLYAGPDEQFDVVGSMPEGSEVKILSKAQGWYKVRYQKQNGWAVGTTMALLDEES